MAAARPTESLIKRTIAAWQSAGLEIAGIEVHPSGAIRILAPGSVTPLRSGGEGNTCDDLFGEGQE